MRTPNLALHHQNRSFARISRCLVRVLLVVISVPAFTQQQNLKFEHLGTHQGLSHSNTICMLEGGRGFMWCGTRDGLNKYDGYSFTVYRNKDGDKFSIGSNNVNEIVEDSNGILWIATWGGLSKYNRESEKFTQYRHDKNNTATISSDKVNSVLIDGDGILWIGTDHGWLDSYDEKSNTFYHHLDDHIDM